MNNYKKALAELRREYTESEFRTHNLAIAISSMEALEKEKPKVKKEKLPKLIKNTRGSYKRRKVKFVTDPKVNQSISSFIGDLLVQSEDPLREADIFQAAISANLLPAVMSENAKRQRIKTVIRKAVSNAEISMNREGRYYIRVEASEPLLQANG